MSHLFNVYVGKKNGFISVDGRLVVPLIYEASSEFSDGLAAVAILDPSGRKDRQTKEPLLKWGFIDSTGEMVIEPRFDGAGPFADGRAVVRVGKGWGYINVKGEFICPPEFQMAHAYSHGLGVVDLGKTRRVLDVDGRTLFETDAARIGPSGEGLLVQEKRRKWSYLHPDGTTAFDLTCSAAGPFSEGLATVLVKGKLGYIDNTGTFLIKPQFAQAGDFHDGLAYVERFQPGKHDFSKRQLWGYVNRQGDAPFPGEFVDVCRFSEGLSPVKRLSRKYFSYIDTAGNDVIERVDCKHAQHFEHGLAWVCLDEYTCDFGYINRQGAFVWKSVAK